MTPTETLSEIFGQCRSDFADLPFGSKIELEGEVVHYCSTGPLRDEAKKVLVIAADDHGCRVWSARDLHESLGAGSIHLHPVLTCTSNEHGATMNR